MFGTVTNVADLRKRQAELKAKATQLNTVATEAGRDLNPAELVTYNECVAELKTIGSKLADHADGARTVKRRNFLLPNHDEIVFPVGRPEDSEEVVSAMDGIKAFLRNGKILETNNPLHIYQSPVSGGLAAAIPTEVLDSLASYFRNDAFALAGATIYDTPDTVPLVKPIISAGSDPDAFVEGQSATDSHPMQVDSFTFGGTKYSRLVKVSEEALMNSALDLPGEILNELAASTVNGFTKTISTALMTALHINESCYVDRSAYVDVYGTMLGLLLAVPPRYEADTNVFMCSRYDLRIIKDVRSTQNEPLFDATSGTIFNRRVVLNDNLHHVIYGNWQAGAFVRKSPFTLLRLIELYSATGEIGFKATQFLDSKFLASVTTVPVQPLFYTNLDSAGS